MASNSIRVVWRAARHVSWSVMAAALSLIPCLASGPVYVWGADVADRRAGDSSFQAELVALAAKCDELELKEQADLSREWFVPRDPRRHYLFLPPSFDSTKPPDTAPRLVKFWHEKFTQLRMQQAQRLFVSAGKLAQAGNEAAAYRLLHEVLHEDPEHEQARHALGYTRGDRGWRRAARATNRRRNRGPHPDFGWAVNQYWQVGSEHFQLTTNLSARAGSDVLVYLERVYAAWQQLFYPYWSVPGRLTARLRGEDQSLGPNRQFSVVLFQDRGEYIRQLNRSVPQIGMSVGFYSQSHKTAFFYAGDDTARTTWVHESTHQFFQETGMVAPQVAERGNFWVVEGVALYMESLIDRQRFVTTGGVDADRLQFARFRKLSEDSYVPSEQLVRYGRQQVQKDPKIRQLYSQSAGFTHFLMHGSEGRFQSSLMSYLKAVYRGVGQPQTLAAEAAQPFTQLDQGYFQYLNVTDGDLRFADPGMLSLCLAHTDVTDAGLAMVPGCSALRWLDLAFTDITDAGMSPFADARELDQLNLEKTQITDATLDVVARLQKLQELDLSQTAITDQGLKKLSRLSQLRVLWLTGTQVTDDGLAALASLRNLEQLDVQSTRVTPAGIAQLRKRLPKLK